MKKTIPLFVAMLFTCAMLLAQNVVLKSPAEIALAKVKELLADEKFKEAATKLEEVLVTDPNNMEVQFYLGSAYQALGQNEKSFDFFLKAKESMKIALADYSGGTNEMRNRHELQYQQRYADEQVNLSKAVNAMKDPEKLSSIVNGPFGDYGPIINPTGTRLYFTSRRPDSGQRSILSTKKKGILESKSKTELDEPIESDEDSYYSDMEGATWGAPIKLPEPLNTDNNEGVDCFTADNQLMLFTACGLEDGVGSCDLYISSMEGDRWQTPKNMGNVVNSVDWDGQSTISYDGTKIFFISVRDAGYGGSDIYMVERNIFGDWGPPVNLGGIVNTPFNEYSPFISQDGKTLYFSSNAHPGFGGLDIFKTVYENGKWSVPVNLGKPLNTSKDDKFFTIGGSGEIGYFSSDRDGKGMDIYQIEIPEEMRPQPTIVITGTVTNAKTKENVGGFVMVEDMDTGELIAVNKSNSVTGKYMVVLPGGRNYSVSANKEGFFFYSQSFEVPKKIQYQEIVKDITLKPIEKGTKVVINNIFFEIGKATLTPQSHLELDKAIDLLRANPTMVIEVGGHTDNVGDDTNNMKLSHDRAKSVREYMVDRGIGTDKIQAKGYGESNPIANNDTDEGRQSNRRTEFIILEF
jgi:outer membrane protein OmpA-like peptidoglycan-associated protein